MSIDEVTYEIRGSAFKIHKELGPGLFESVYERVLKYELERKGLEVSSQISIPVLYDGLKIEEAFRLDLLVEQTVIVEIKSIERLMDVHFKQLTTYLKLADKKVGYLINFNCAFLKDRIDIVRIVNSF